MSDKERVLAVECPWCHAVAGSSCVGISRRELKDAHLRRWEAASENAIAREKKKRETSEYRAFINDQGFAQDKDIPTSRFEEIKNKLEAL